MRVRAKNPLIERKATLRRETETAAITNSPLKPETADRPSTANPQDFGGSLYDRLERTDQPDELSAAVAQLEEAFGPEAGHDAPSPQFPEQSVPRPAAPARTERPEVLAVPPPRAPAMNEPTVSSRPRPAARGPARSAPADPSRNEAASDPVPIVEQTVRGRPPARDAAPLPSAPAPTDDEETVVARSRAPTAVATPNPDKRPTADGPKAEAPPKVEAQPAAEAQPKTATPANAAQSNTAARPNAAAQPNASTPSNVVTRAEGLAPSPSPIAAADPIPRSRWVASGTKAAGAELRRQKILRDAELPDIRSGALKLYTGAVSADHLHRLDAIISSDGDDDHDLGRLMSSAEPLLALLEDRAFVELPLEDRAELLTTVAENDDDLTTVKVAHTLARSGVLNRLSGLGRKHLHRIFRDLDTGDRVRLARLAARKASSGSVLVEVDARGVFLVDHLRALFDGGEIDPWWSTQGLQPKAVASLVLGTLAHPARISPEEGADGVVAALEFCLADRLPAELARLWRGLLCGDLRLLGGDRVDSALLRQHLSRPTPIRDLLALLPELLAKRSGFVTGSEQRLDPDALSAVLKPLFGAAYVAVAGAATAERRLRALDAERPGPAFVSMLSERDERLFVFDRFEAEHVLVRAPQGRSAKRTGNERSAPRRTVVDPEAGLDRIDLKTFQEAVGIALVPFD